VWGQGQVILGSSFQNSICSPMIYRGGYWVDSKVTQAKSLSL
jgi:hypothetical protein